MQRGGEHPGHAALAQDLGQIPGGAFGDHLVVDQRQPVPEFLEALQEPDQPGVVERFKGPVFDQLDQVIEADVEILQRLLRCGWIPDIHDHMLLEQVFEYKQISQENKENRLCAR